MQVAVFSGHIKHPDSAGVSVDSSITSRSGNDALLCILIEDVDTVSIDSEVADHTNL